MSGLNGHAGPHGQSISSTSSIQSTRERVCEIARSWLGTPYHHMGRIKGVGVDCAMFPLEVYREAGLMGDIEVPYYPPDWMLHRSEEIYLRIVQQHACEVTGDRLQGTGGSGFTVPCNLSPLPCLPGDLALYRFGRCWSHGAIVIQWPLIIHALTSKGVLLADGEREGCLVGRARRFFSPWR